jgi:hypothetical protein
MIADLTLRQTFRLWGGFNIPLLEDSVVYCRDVSKYMHGLGRINPATTRVGAVHLNVLRPFLMLGLNGGKVKYTRQLLACRNLLLNEGYTHVLVTGPMLLTLDLDKRIKIVTRYKPHVLPSIIAAVGTWLSFQVAGLLMRLGGRGVGNTVGFDSSFRHIWLGFRVMELRAL